MSQETFRLTNVPLLCTINTDGEIPCIRCCHECGQDIEKNQWVQVEVGRKPYDHKFYLHLKCYVTNQIKPDDYCRVTIILFD